MQDPWLCPEDVVAQTPCHPLQGFRTVGLEPSMPLEGDRCPPSWGSSEPGKGCCVGPPLPLPGPRT